jgi:hypothetical protein
VKSHRFWKDDVGRKIHSILNSLQFNFLDFSAHFLEGGMSRQDPVPNLPLQPVEKVLFGNTDPQATHSLWGRKKVRFSSWPRAAQAGSFLSGNHAQHQRRVLHTPAERTYMIKAEGEGNNPMSGNEAKGWLQSHNPAGGSRKPDGSSRIGSQGSKA